MSELDGLKLLRRIEEGVAGKTGEAFFRQIVQDLALALNAHAAFSSSLLPDRRAGMLAFWAGDCYQKCVEYSLAGTPCEFVYRGEITSYARNIGEVFPVDREWFEQLGVRSYLGIPMKNESGAVFGHLAVMDKCERDWRDADVDTLRLFSLRSAAEIERTRYQTKLERTNAALRDANEQLQAEIARRIATEAQLASAKSAAESANQAKSVFISHMSHELRTPLNGILGYTQLLKRDSVLSREKLADGLGVIERSGEHLLKLVNELLDLARVESGRIELSRDLIDLRELVQHVATLAQPKIAQAGVTFSVEGPHESLPAVITDERVLRQVMLNLLGNAAKFTNRGGAVSLRVQCERVETAQYLARLSVEDTGIGIAQEELDRIFEPFHRVSTPGRIVEGTGLGLAITRRLVEAMGGRLLVDSRPGEGSTFTVEIALEAAPARVSQPAPPAQIAGYSGDTRTVLIADDNGDNRALVRELLESVGFVVAIASDGADALRVMRRSVPDLILTDLVMPEMDGIALVRTVRGDPHLAGIPVIAMSASASEYTRQDALQAGCSAFLSKPLDLAALLTEVGTLLGLEWQRQEAAVARERSEQNAILRVFDLDPMLAAELYHLALQGDILSLVSRVEATLATDAAAEPFCAQIRALATQFDVRGIRQTLVSNCSAPLSG
jgi:signal transduction histidine kinase/FixJ family two-component response regulator